jgi:hypothetical protein
MAPQRWISTRTRILAGSAGVLGLAACGVVDGATILGRSARGDTGDEATGPGGAMALVPSDQACDAGVMDCTVVLERGAVPWEDLGYQLAPGDRWVGQIERVQPCLRADGRTVPETLVAIVVATVTAADATGNLAIRAAVGDVYLSEPDADPAGLGDLRPATASEALFDRSGLPVKPLRPPLVPSLLLTPLPGDAVGPGARWEVQVPDQGLDGVTQYVLDALTGPEVVIRGLTGDWLDDARTTQRTTGVSTTRARLDELGPVERVVELTTPSACFEGAPAAGVRYTLTRQG